MFLLIQNTRKNGSPIWWRIVVRKCYLYQARRKLGMDMRRFPIGNLRLPKGQDQFTAYQSVYRPDLYYLHLWNNRKPERCYGRTSKCDQVIRNNGMVELNENTIILQTGSMAFDASTFEVWGTLGNQGTLILSNKDILLDVSKLKDAIQQYQVNTMWMTVTLYNQTIEEDSCVFNALSTLIIGGERLTEKTVHILKQQESSVRLVNGYGPTETTTFAAMYEIPTKFSKIPIGKPIGNTEIYIVKDGQLCDVGVPGEIWIGGAGVARGYLNNEALTEERFLPNPYGKGKLYRSGDLGKYAADGNIEYLGRLDEQVKIRGYRIELSAIEHALLSMDKIKQAVVIDKKTDSDHFIYAYVTSDTELNLMDVRASMKEKLPKFMIPNRMLQIEEIPVTTNGKVDKRQLPEIKHQSMDYVEPRNDVEWVLHDIFAEYLNIERVSIRDHFIFLGGHSLIAAKIANRIFKELNKQITSGDILKLQTIEAISSILENTEAQEYDPIDKAEEKTYYPMSPAQRRMFLQQGFNKDSVVYNIPLLYKVSAKVNQNKMTEAIMALVNRHEILRTTYDIVDGQGVQIVRDDLPIDVEYILEDVVDNRKYIQPFRLGKRATISD